MTWLVQPRLINDPFGDAGLYLDFRFARRALLFDLGDLHKLPPRKLLRVSNVFVSHAHMDHFCGFDRLLGVCLGRPLRLELFGPPGFIDRVQHKLAAYSWNLIAGNATDFVIGVSEMHGESLAAAAEFHTRDAFRRKELPPPVMANGILVDEVEFRVRAVTLDHGIPCLAFAFEAKPRINVWKDRLRRLGLPVGPWLTDLKQAVRRGEPDETLIHGPVGRDGRTPGDAGLIGPAQDRRPAHRAWREDRLCGRRRLSRGQRRTHHPTRQRRRPALHRIPVP